MNCDVSIILSGLNLVESYPYETVHKDYDYVRLASITAGNFTDLHQVSPNFIQCHPLNKFCSSTNT